MTKQTKLDVKLLVAYWCNYTVPDNEERFSWALEEIDMEIVREVGQRARTTLIALAQSAPDERAAAYLAAGPLEDYINLIVANKQADEASFIFNSNDLKPLLEHVWGDIKKLEPLANSGNQEQNEYIFETDLKILGLKEVAGFWCHVCSSKVMDDYAKYYSQVEKKLFNKKTRQETMHDLLLSAPDQEAEEYLENNIFILQK